MCLMGLCNVGIGHVRKGQTLSLRLEDVGSLYVLRQLR